MPVTRDEIIGLIGSVFGPGSATRGQILHAALEQRARPRVLETLEQLPERSYRHVRELWDKIPEVAIEA